MADQGGGHGGAGRGGGGDSALARVVATLAPRRRLQSEPSITRGGFARASPAKVRLLFEEREKRFRPHDSCHASFDPLFNATPRKRGVQRSWRCDKKRESRWRKKKKKRKRGPILCLLSTCHDRETEEESSGERDGASRHDTIPERVKKMGKSAASGHDPSDTRNAGFKKGIFDRPTHVLGIEKTYMCRLLKETRVFVSKIRIRPVLVSIL